SVVEVSIAKIRTHFVPYSRVGPEERSLDLGPATPSYDISGPTLSPANVARDSVPRSRPPVGQARGGQSHPRPVYALHFESPSPECAMDVRTSGDISLLPVNDYPPGWLLSGGCGLCEW
ncbi:MAG: hypothetical protein ACQESR_10630, partial [Planctomycetota bacterium]